MKLKLIAAIAALAGVAFTLWIVSSPASMLALQVPGHKMKDTRAEIGPKPATLAVATFAAGCFWGVESTFRETPGVWKTTVGYSGGRTQNPTYKEVCTDQTGHAEAVQVEYDPTKVKYEDLVQIFWDNHNPTTLNRQGPDYGSQYRSVIFYHNDDQKLIAEESKKKLGASGKWRSPIVTEIVPAAPFYEAEDYHQQYLEKRGLRSCHM